MATAPPASGKSDGEPLKVHPKLPSSAGEDRATLLGIAMMASSVLMFFLLGTTVLKPFMLSSNREESNCTTIHTHIADDWLNFAFTCEGSCQDQGGYPCLQVFVNLTHSGQKVLLHYDDEAVRTNPKCFYTPKCHQDRDDLLNTARDIKEFFDHRNGTFTCFYSPDGQLGVVLRKSGHKCEQYSMVVRVQAGGRAPSVGRRRSSGCSVTKSQGRSRGLKRQPHLSHPEMLQLTT
ncbi:calcium-activated potassium channel subunit beta-3 [Peromyscus eremicus]|uniref:calcium-activated potassium channel subunit beta-3 n=1 Tax=Peromyscus eremicus TaxID=42410 RepID=UPI0027DAFBE3|nr:calcium-activated potassium channel subunit beta-3 [Peromyscus eremicus]